MTGYNENEIYEKVETFVTDVLRDDDEWNTRLLISEIHFTIIEHFENRQNREIEKVENRRRELEKEKKYFGIPSRG